MAEIYKSDKHSQPPDEKQIVSLEEFRFAFDLALHAANRTMPVTNPGEYSFSLLKDDGTTGRFSFRDIPFNRASFALADHYGVDSTEKLRNAKWRIMRVMDLIYEDAMEDWVRESSEEPDARKVHPAVIDAAVSIKLTKSGKIPPQRFLERIQKIADEKYADL